MMWQPTKDQRLKKRGQVYWARFTKNGQTVEKSLETKSFDIARRLADSIEQDVLLGINWRKSKEYFETAWPDFLSDKTKGIKTKKARPKTLKEYIGFGERFYIPNFSEVRLTDLEDAWEHLVDKIKTEKPDMQFDNLRKYIMGFASWAHRKGKIKDRLEFFDPDIERKENAEEEGPGISYTLEQLAIQREHAEKAGKRYCLFVYMGHYEGMRPWEITQLKKTRIKLDENVIKLRRADTKTKSARTIPIHPIVKSKLVEQMSATESEYLFPNQRDIDRPMDPNGFKKYWYELDEAGRLRDWRSSFITHAINQGVNPFVVAKMTGTSLKMIEKFYLKFSATDLNKEIEKFRL